MNIDKLREIIVEANPKIRTYENRCMTCGYGFEYCKCKPKRIEWYIDREIRLADVLLAIGNKSVGVDATGEIVIVKRYDDRRELVTTWNFADNNLDNQSDECKEFLIKLLVK